MSGHIKKFMRKYKDWQTEQEEKAKAKDNKKNDAVQSKVDDQQNALLEAQRKQMMEMMEQQKKYQEEQAKKMAEQQKKYQEEMEKLKNSASNKWDNKSFVYQSNMDTNGIVWGLGTEWNQMGWTNPATTGKIMLQCSGTKNDSKPMSAICGRDSVRCLTAETEDAWISLNFANSGLRICPTYYSLRHYASWNIEALRSWNLEGSINGYVGKSCWQIIYRSGESWVQCSFRQIRYI